MAYLAFLIYFPISAISFCQKSFISATNTLDLKLPFSRHASFITLPRKFSENSRNERALRRFNGLCFDISNEGMCPLLKGLNMIGKFTDKELGSMTGEEDLCKTRKRSANGDQKYNSELGPSPANKIRKTQLKKYDNKGESQDRRSFLIRSSLAIYSGGTTGMGLTYSSLDNEAKARGLIRFPCKDPLLNTYHFLRAGSSLLELEDVWSTNPLFLTNREAALSDLGDAQVRESCNIIRSAGISPTVIRYSLAAASVDSANILGEELKIGRDRLVPEFNYMDPRAIGGWDFAALNATEEAVWALDADEAGIYGRGGRPPPNEDGTPAETLSDQVVRLTNLMSVLETLYSGDTVLLIFPDGTGPALLSCLIGGIPLNRVHELNFKAGEIRFDVNYNSVNSIASLPPPSAYTETLQRGREELYMLRQNPGATRNVKDLKYEEEQRAEEERERKKKEARQKEEERKKELEMQKKLQESSSKSQNDFSDNEIKGVIGGSSIGAVAAIGGVGIALTTFGSNETTHVIESDLILNTTISQTSSERTDELGSDQFQIKEEEKGRGDNVITDADTSKLYNSDEAQVITSKLQKRMMVLEPDDGGDAWLSMISDILNEDDDENARK